MLRVKKNHFIQNLFRTLVDCIIKLDYFYVKLKCKTMLSTHQLPIYNLVVLEKILH